MEKTLATRYAEAVDQIDAHRQSIAAANERIASLQVEADKVPALVAKITELEANAVEANTQHESALTEKATRISELGAEVKDLTDKLALSPGHKDVSAGTSAVPSTPGEDSQNDIVAQFAAIKDPAEKTAFYKKNAKALWTAAK